MTERKEEATIAGTGSRPIAEHGQSAATPNVVILTSGLSGSSVLAGLIGRSGHWLGDATFKKEYDTYENSELIGLNLQILQQAGYTGSYTKQFSQEVIERVASLSGRIDETPYRNFLGKCEAHSPWVWKDPRLWLTIRLWAKFLPMGNCRFILLTRDLRHAWVSSTLRRHIRSYRSLERYETSIKYSILTFLQAEGLSCLHVTYESLIARPEQTIEDLNRYLHTHLAVEDLSTVYRGPLYKTPRNSPVDYIKAALIYLKNYSERIDLEEEEKRKTHRGPETRRTL